MDPAATAALYASHVLKDGDSFLVANGYGDIEEGSTGLFRDDTRLLSMFRLRLAETQPALLSAAVTDDKYHGVTNAVVLGVPAGTTFDRASETRWGGVVGVGLEYGFSPNWSMAVEYDHLFMGNRNITMTSTGTFLPAGTLSRVDNIGQDVDLVTVRVNYRWGGPVIAKY